MAQQYIVTGMTCAACQAHVERAVSKLNKVDSVTVSLLTNSMSVDGTASSKEVIDAVEKAGYGAKPKGDEGSNTGENLSDKIAAEEDALKDRETPRLKKRLFLSILFLGVLMYITMGHNMLGLPVPASLEHNHLGLALTQMIIAIIVMAINRSFFVSGFRSLVHLGPNMDTLVALGASVSFVWSLYVFYKMTVMVTDGVSNMELMSVYHDQLYFETAAMIPALITVGKTLEAMSKGRTTDALKNLLRMAPKTAVVERGGEQLPVSIDEIQTGDIFVVKPGESIPADGIITYGSTAIDESALTGESIPVDKEVGDMVFSATINRSGFIKARATRVGEDTTFSQIIQMVSDAAATKAPIARIADKVSGVFVPAVIGIAAAVFVVWMASGEPVTFALERAIAVLVVSCPCALGLATPVAIMVGNGVGAKNGILFKTSEALEMTGRIQIAALDKTGTITKGSPVVTDVIPAGEIQEAELLQVAYSLEKQSEHPLAKAIVDYGTEQKLDALEVREYSSLAGNGLCGRIDGVMYRGGSESFIADHAEIKDQIRKRSDLLCGQGKTPLFFEREGCLLGMIAVADVIKEDSAQAVKELQAQGIEVVMLTGDNERTANAIGTQAGVDRVIAGVLPEGKEAAIRQLQDRGRVAMVGDGINDAPALTRASADIVLMNSKLSDVPGAIRLSRATLRNIHENLFWAFAYNVILIPIAAGLYPHVEMNPMWGAAAMAVSSFTVCMNALRLNLFDVHDASKDRRMRKPAMPENARTDNDTAGEAEVSETVIMVEGMMCENCEKHVAKALENIDGIIGAVSDHTSGMVKVKHNMPLDETKINDAITEEGYEYTGILPG